MSRKGEGVSKQVTNIFQEADMLDIGSHAGHRTKTEYRDMAREEGHNGSHGLSQQVPVTNSNTWSTVKGYTVELGHFQRAHGGGTNLRRVTPEMVRDYIQSKVDAGLSVSTIDNVRFAITKFSACVPKISEKIFEVTQEFKGAGKVLEVGQIRFNDPEKVIANIQDPRCQAIAQLQLSTGLRVQDACRIRLNGDGHTIDVHSKAGHRFKNFDIGKENYERIAQFAPEGKTEFSLSKVGHYRYELQKACAAAGEKMSRTHSFRHNYAYNLYSELRAKGYGHNAARAEVSKALFHERLEVVDRYINS